MATFGALMGSIIAGLAYKLSNRNYTVTFSLSAVPALAALLLVTTVSSLDSSHLMDAASMQACLLGCLPTSVSAAPAVAALHLVRIVRSLYSCHLMYAASLPPSLCVCLPISVSAVPSLAVLLLVTTVSSLDLCQQLAWPLGYFCVRSACRGCTAFCQNNKLMLLFIVSVGQFPQSW